MVRTGSMVAAQRIAVVGEDGVGKKALVRALGAVPVTSFAHDDKVRPTATSSSTEYEWGVSRVELQIFRERQQLVTFRNNNNSDNSSSAEALVCIVVFDLTHKDSFTAAIAQWSCLANADDTHVVLVGTKLDKLREREVFFDAESMGLAEMEVREYVEVSATQPPFEGVKEVECLLRKWTHLSDSDDAELLLTEGKRVEVPAAAVPHHRSRSVPDPVPNAHLSPKRKPCIRASVWLYDPTEDHPPSPEQDVKLRPISKALFEIRGAGHDKAKSLAKYKDREANKLMQRSKYYGPTESSRHMRWQEEQKRLQLEAGHVRPRSASQGANVSSSRSDRYREHELIASKSFIQTTELVRQRKIELLEKKKALVANGTRSLTPERTRDRAQQKRTKKLAMALNAVPEEEQLSPKKGVKLQAPRSPELLSVSRIHQQSRSRCTNRSVDAEAPLREHHPKDRISPGGDHDTTLPTPLPIAHLQSPIPRVLSPSPSSSKMRRASLCHVPSPTYDLLAMDSESKRACDPTTWQPAQQDPLVKSGSEGNAAEESMVGDTAATSVEKDVAEVVETSQPCPRDADASFDAMADIDDMLDYFDGVSLPI